jgi:hypothetical protein
MSFEVTVTPTVYDVEVSVNPSVQPFDVEVITNQDLADLVDEAKQYAEDAEDSADSASASASSASASALASANSASSASASASSASGSANTATTQAGIATTQAGIATTQAGIATTKAQEASQSASDALASEQASAQSASDALASEQASAQSASDALASEQASALSEANALASEQSALSSAQSASASASSASQSAQDAQDAVDSLVFGNLTEATSSVLTIGGGTGAVFGTGTTIQVKQASGLQSGFLSSTDWSTFNNKVSSNLFTANGTLAGNRTITLGGFTLDVIGSTFTNRFSTAGRLLLGNPTESTFLLDVAGEARIVPLANATPLTISGYSLTGSNAQSALSITGTWNTTGTPTLIFANVTNTLSNGASLLMDLQLSGTSIFKITRGGLIESRTILFSGGASSTTTVIDVNRSFVPTSGSDPFTIFTYRATINQTGGANGITRGLYVNPTLTSAADWRSIEWSNNTGRGLWGAGTADNAIAGALNVGSASNANASAILELTSTTRGLLLPRMTSAQRDAIASPVAGLVVYNTTDNKISWYNGTAWANL